jgi:transposase
VSPHSGEDFTLIARNVNTKRMNVFLEHMSRYLGNRKALIVMDCAGWHKSKTLLVPSNIKIIYLPPYSPELNPVERLWLHIKRNTIRNKIYETLESLEDAIISFIKALQPQTIAHICSINYL